MFKHDSENYDVLAAILSLLDPIAGSEEGSLVYHIEDWVIEELASSAILGVSQLVTEDEYGE